MAPDPTAKYRQQQHMAPVTHSYDPVVVDWIVKSAKQTGADPAALLATSLQESGARRGAVGDRGTSFGPFQFHVGGALGSHSPAWANTYAPVLNRAQEFARLGVHGGTGAAAVQRPQDRALYAQGVDKYLAQAKAILAHYTGQPAAPAKPPVAQPAQPVSTQPLSSGVIPGNALLQSLIDANAANAGIQSIQLPAMPQLTTPTVPATPTPAKPAATVTPTIPGGAAWFKPGGGWAGSHNLARAMAQIGLRNGLSIASEKRDRKMTASGGVSDHWTGSKNAYAFDLSNGSSPTPQMDATAAQIAAQLGVKGWKGGVLNVTKGGYRFQVLYRTSVGGNHWNHVHLGVRKV